MSANVNPSTPVRVNVRASEPGVVDSNAKEATDAQLLATTPVSATDDPLVYHGDVHHPESSLRSTQITAGNTVPPRARQSSTLACPTPALRDPKAKAPPTSYTPTKLPPIGEFSSPGSGKAPRVLRGKAIAPPGTDLAFKDISTTTRPSSSKPEATSETEASGPNASTATSKEPIVVDEHDGWKVYFPHNVDYSTVTVSYTKDDLLREFKADNYAKINLRIGTDGEKAKLAKEIYEAIGKGWDASATLDEEADVEDLVIDEDDDEEDKAAAKARYKKDANDATHGMNARWDKAKEEFEPLVVRAGFRVGYMSAKKVDCIRDGKQFIICEHNRGYKDYGCMTNQYSRSKSRSCISDYFGRNKAITNLIPSFYTTCRKHYQTEAYMNDKWNTKKYMLIIRQLKSMEADVQAKGKPGLTYNIQLVKCDQERLVEERMDTGLKGAPKPNNKHPAALEDIKYIFENYIKGGGGRTMADCIELVVWAQKRFLERYAAWKEGKSEKECKALFKKEAPKFVGFQMLPEYEKIYSAQEIKEILKKKGKKGAAGKAVVKKETALEKPKATKKRSLVIEEDDEEEEDYSPPSKKSKKA